MKKVCKHSILLWWHDDKGYFPFKYDGHRISTIEKVAEHPNDIESRLIPEDVVRGEWIPAFRRDGWIIKIDEDNKHVAALCPMHRNLTVRNLAWLIGDVIE